MTVAEYQEAHGDKYLAFLGSPAGRELMNMLRSVPAMTDRALDDLTNNGAALAGTIQGWNNALRFMEALATKNQQKKPARRYSAPVKDE